MSDVSRETAARLDCYAALLRKWNPAINLVAPATLVELGHRHIADSAQIYDLAQPQQGNWIDLGSGGGLPGVVVAILAHAQPLTVTLVESDRRKAAFLTTARRELDLSNLHIRCQRIETIPDAAHDFVSARALASVKNLLPNLARQLASQGEAWLLKGRSWRGEVELARQDWSFDMEVFPSATDPESVVLKLRNIERHV